MTSLFRIEFYAIHEPQSPLGFDTVDEEVALADVRQVMANWYRNMTEQEARYRYEVHYGTEGTLEWDELDADEQRDPWEEEDVHAPFVGAFIVRDSQGRVVERVASEMVRHAPEMARADPVWFEHKDPDTERIRAEAEERYRQEHIRRIESADYLGVYGREPEDDVPF